MPEIKRAQWAPKRVIVKPSTFSCTVRMEVDELHWVSFETNRRTIDTREQTRTASKIHEGTEASQNPHLSRLSRDPTYCDIENDAPLCKQELLDLIDNET